jgi:ABC-type transport system substrate-binding protein
VKFHNGREMTAEDVQYSLNRVLDTKTASPGRSYIATVKSIDVLDRYTVKLTLAGPLPSLLDGLASNNLPSWPGRRWRPTATCRRSNAARAPSCSRNGSPTTP